MPARRSPAPGGRPHVVAVRLTPHEKAWIDAHRGSLGAGAYLVTCLQQVQAEVAREERLEQMGDTD